MQHQATMRRRLTFLGESEMRGVLPMVRPQTFARVNEWQQHIYECAWHKQLRRWKWLDQWRRRTRSCHRRCWRTWGRCGCAVVQKKKRIIGNIHCGALEESKSRAMSRWNKRKRSPTKPQERKNIQKLKQPNHLTWSVITMIIMCVQAKSLNWYMKEKEKKSISNEQR